MAVIEDHKDKAASFDNPSAYAQHGHGSRWAMGKVIYLTGAPAAGKSSTCQLLRQTRSDLLVWEYGARLTEYLTTIRSDILDQSTIRERSSRVVTPEDVATVDNMLLQFVEDNRSSRHIIIDSHPVTKEAFGFRITPFSLVQFGQLAPNEIWVLYATPAETQRRIGLDAGGRPSVTEEEARFHTYLQASVAATYGVGIGVPVYLFESADNLDLLVASLLGRLP